MALSSELLALSCEARVSGSLSGSLLSIMFYIAIKSFQALLNLSRQAMSCEAALNSSLKLLLVAVVIFIIGCYFYVAHSKIFIK